MGTNSLFPLRSHPVAYIITHVSTFPHFTPFCPTSISIALLCNCDRVSRAHRPIYHASSHAIVIGVNSVHKFIRIASFYTIITAERPTIDNTVNRYYV